MLAKWPILDGRGRIWAAGASNTKLKDDEEKKKRCEETYDNER